MNRVSLAHAVPVESIERFVDIEVEDIAISEEFCRKSHISATQAKLIASDRSLNPFSVLLPIR